VKLRDLEDSLNEKSALLDHDRQLLRASHDVTDLMGARNLHIVDVVDTDSRVRVDRRSAGSFYRGQIAHLLCI